MDRETAEEIKNEFRRQLAVLRETVHSGLDRIVEGQESLSRELGGLRGEFAGLRADVSGPGGRFDAFRVAMCKEFEETRAMIRLLSENSSGASSTSKPGCTSSVRASSASKRS